MEDKQLACTACGTEFTFTGEEQEFYLSKGFQEPKKCKPGLETPSGSHHAGCGETIACSGPSTGWWWQLN